MADQISGTNILVYKFDSDTMEDIPFACGQRATLTVNSALQEVTSATSAYNKEYKVDMISWSIQVTGFTILNDQWNYFHFLDAIQDRESFVTKFVVDNGDALGLTIVSGNVFIQDYQLEGNYNELSSYSVTLVGTGAYSTSGTVVTPGGSIIISGTTLQVFQTTAAGGETTITFSGAVGLDALYASRGGTTMQPIAYAGSPEAPNGAVWDTSDAGLDIAEPAFSGEKFLILAQ